MHNPTLLATAALLLPTTLVQAAGGLYTKTSPVLQLTSTNFDSLINRSNHTSIIEFYAPWCGHCQNLKPAYEKAAKSLSGLAKVAAVNCDEEENKPLCGQMGVQGFPTLKIARPAKKSGRPAVEDYQGARSAKAIVDAVVEKIPNHVARLKDGDYEAWLEKTDGPKAVLFTEKGVVSALMKAIAIDFLGVMDVGQIRDREKQAVEVFGVDKFPTLVLLPGGEKDAVKYEGEMKKEAILAFLSQAASPNPDPAPKKSKSSSTNKKSASKASSSFSKASASHASSEKPAPQSSESLEDESNPTESPNPQPTHQQPVELPKATPIPTLHDGLSLQQKCLNDKASTCILALLPQGEATEQTAAQAIQALSEIHHKHENAKRKLFPFYQLSTSNSQAGALRSKLSLSDNDIELIAVNGKRAWYRHFTPPSSSSPNPYTSAALEDWIDAIRMGDGAKEKLPAALIAGADALPKEDVKVDWSQMPEGMQEQLKDSGLEYEFEEIDDVQYEAMMKKAEQEGKEAPESVVVGEEDGHDEL